MKRRSSAACIAVALSATVYTLIVRPWHLRWGASDDEVGADLPGDNLIDRADLVATRAISVRATAGEVWPWIAAPLAAALGEAGQETASNAPPR